MHARLRRGVAMLWIGVASVAQAQTGYPAQPIKVIVPFPPAGGTDVVTRLLLDRMHATTNWNFVVDNRPGAGGNIGMDAVAKSKPDGYTLGMGQTANLAINPTLYSKVPFNVGKDFTPVALIAGQAVVLVVNPASPWKTVADLVAAAKASPSKVTMASAGNGTVGHLTGELFARQAGITINHIPYKGAGPAATDLLGGQVDFYFATPQAVVPFVKSGKLRALAVSSGRRMPALPEVPTVAESGFKDFDITDWKVLVAPAGTPPEIVKRLNAEAAKAMASPEATARLAAEGSIALTGSPEQVAAYLKAEEQRWGAVVKASGLKVD